MDGFNLEHWRDFYLTLGTAAGVLVGASFVVATISGGLGEKTKIGMRGFITPTIVHLGCVLVISVLLTAPVMTMLAMKALLVIAGLAGALYMLVILARIRTMKLDLSDRAFYLMLPLLSYAGLAVAGLIDPAPGLIATAAILVLLLIIGMRNAWDMASFLIIRDIPDDKPPE